MLSGASVSRPSPESALVVNGAFIEEWSFTSECFYLLFSPMHRGVAGFGPLLPVHWELSLRN